VTVVGGGALSYKGWANWYQNVNEMGTMQWRAQFSDLNLIEAFWLGMRNELRQTWSRIGNTCTLEVVLNIV